jgi:hypothetical protein
MSKKTRMLIGEQGGHTLELESTGKNLYVLFDGVRIAKRGRPGAKDTGKWVSLGPGWEVRDVGEGDQQQIEVIRNGEVLLPIGPGSSEVH